MAINAIPFETRYGTEYVLAFKEGRYIKGDGLAVEVWCAPPNPETPPSEMEWEPYGVLTVNLGATMPEGLAYLDSNNLPDLVEFAIGKEWATKVGSGRSGYCEYPLVQFSDEFLNRVCMTEEGE